MELWDSETQKLQLSDGKWTYLSGYVRSSGRAIFDHWKKALEDAEKACGDLPKGVDHPKVAQVVKILKGRAPPGRS